MGSKLAANPRPTVHPPSKVIAIVMMSPPTTKAPRHIRANKAANTRRDPGVVGRRICWAVPTHKPMSPNAAAI